MTTKRSDGGPAFPVAPDGVPKQEYRAGEPYGDPIGSTGMTLRDWYAGKTLEGLLSSPIGEGGEPATVALAGPLGQFIADSLAIVSYRVADAMLKERDRG